MSNKRVALLLVLLFILPAILPLVPIHPVYASTGQPLLGYVDSRSAVPTTVGVSSYNVSLRLTNEMIVKMDGVNVAPPAYFTIFFYNNSWTVTFSGAQFKIYLSKDGFSQINSSDELLPGIFNVADLDRAYPYNVSVNTPDGPINFTLGTFAVGGNTYKVLVGPIYKKVSSDFKYIKIYDGSTTFVAVTKQIIDILPTLFISPSEGSAGTLTVLSGVGFPANSVVELSYTSPIAKSLANVTTDALGMFSYGAFEMLDLKNDYSPPGYQNIVIKENYTSYTVTFKEYSRRLTYLESEVYGDVIGPTNIGNGTAVLDVYIFDTVNVTGNYFYANKAVKLYIGSTLLGNITANGTGFFTLTFEVPELSLGSHWVKIIDGNNVLFNFTINVHPTLILTPDTGPIGTVVTATAYGFPADANVYLYWGWICADDYYYWLFNATTGSDGKFNITVTFTVPHTWGGDHYVYATSTYYGNYTSSISWLSRGVFTVTPTIQVIPDVISNDGSEFKIVVNGLYFNEEYVLLLDHTNTFLRWTFSSNCTGDLLIELVAAGFRPGLHVVTVYSLYNHVYVDSFNESEVTYALFNVATDNDVVVGDINANTNAGFASITASLDTLSADLSSLSDSVDTGFANVLAQLDTLSTAVADLSSGLSALNDHLTAVHDDIMAALSDLSSDVSSVLTSLSGIESSLSSLSDSVSGLSTTLSGVSSRLDSVVSGLGNLATKSDLSSLATKSDVGNVASGVNKLSSDMATTLGSLSSLVTATAVLVVITLIIAAVATFKVFKS